MNTLIALAFLGLFAYLVWNLRKLLYENISYKSARAQEIKRRLQVEYRNDQAMNERLKQPMEDNERMRLITKYAHERHQRAVHYVIADMFERFK
jgi:cell division protein FtsB